MNVAFHTLGCKLNFAETATYERAFRDEGFKVVPMSSGDVDLFVINTCTVTEHANQKARGVIHRAHRNCPGAKIVVTGCYAQMRPDEVGQIEGVAMVVGSDEKQNLVSGALTMMGIQTRMAESHRNVFPAFSIGERTRAFLKVQDGCNNYCAYCTVPFARGNSRNIPACEIVKEAETIATNGVKEIVITGVNTGDFGRSTGESFLDLLKSLNNVHGVERYRISSIEPNLITEEIIDWIASGTKFQPHFHIPLQTGSDELLKKMGRKYDTVMFAEKIDCIRSRMEVPGKPKVFFGIDTMVGLPGETDELFAETCSFIKNIRPAFIHIFPYSKRPGTRAAVMPGQVPERIKKERADTLESLCRELSARFEKENKGIREKVLFESKEKDGMMSGYTGNYIKIYREYDPELVGKIVDVVI